MLEMQTDLIPPRCPQDKTTKLNWNCTKTYWNTKHSFDFTQKQKEIKKVERTLYIGCAMGMPFI